MGGTPRCPDRRALRAAHDGTGRPGTRRPRRRLPRRLGDQPCRHAGLPCPAGSVGSHGPGGSRRAQRTPSRGTRPCRCDAADGPARHLRPPGTGHRRFGRDRRPRGPGHRGLRGSARRSRCRALALRPRAGPPRIRTAPSSRTGRRRRPDAPRRRPQDLPPSRAAPWAARAAEELRATGRHATWGAHQDLGAGRLTEQEHQIAALAATGLSNKQIGERLFFSHRTVGAHLHRIFRKLGVTSRVTLGEALAGARLAVPGGTVFHLFAELEGISSRKGAIRNSAQGKQET